MADNILANVGSLASALTGNVNTAQDVFTMVLPPKRLAANRRLRITINGSVTTVVSLATSVTFSVTFGSETISFPSFSLLTALTNSDFSLVITIYANLSTSQQNYRATLTERLAVVSLTNQATIRSMRGTFTQNLLLAVPVKVQVAFGGILNIGNTLMRDDAVADILG